MRPVRSVQTIDASRSRHEARRMMVELDRQWLCVTHHGVVIGIVDADQPDESGNELNQPLAAIASSDTGIRWLRFGASESASRSATAA